MKRLLRDGGTECTFWRITSPVMTLGVLTLVVAILLIGGCGNNPISHPKDWTSVSVTLARTICQKTCPVYSVTVHGTGAVEYEGSRGVPIRGPITSTLTRDRVAAILDAIDRAKLMSMDQGAFKDVSDAPYVIVSLSVDGKNKQVRSIRMMGDLHLPLWTFLFNSGAREQVRFMKLADELDSLIGTDQWIKCSPKCMILVRGPGWIDSRDQHGASILLQAIEFQRNIPLGSLDPSTAIDFDPATMIEAGVDVNAPDDQGLTPLMAASKNGDTNLIRNLLQHGADPATRDKKARTALDFTKSSEVRALLSSWAPTRSTL